MRIFIATDYYLNIFEGKYYLGNAFYSILKRYRENFGSVVLCTRVKAVDNPRTLIDATDLIESVVGIKDLSESFTYSCMSKMTDAIKNCDLVVGRVPSITAYRAYDCAKKLGKPFLAESMGCAWDAYWNHGIVGKVIAPYMFYKMKSVVKNADFSLYVTNEFLQKRYPCKKPSVAASNVKVNVTPADVLEKRLDRISKTDPKNITLVTTAAVYVKYKGQEYVIKAMPALKKMGINVTYVLIGDGDQRYLRSVAKKCNVENNVIFTGRLSLDEVFDQIDNADIYIQPSLQEGLPRSVIEAMSRGCPCLGARTAGIPELIDPECVFKRKSAASIVKAITAMLNNGLEKYASTNFKNASMYYEDVLDAKRNEYYKMVKDHI